MGSLHFLLSDGLVVDHDQSSKALIVFGATARGRRLGLPGFPGQRLKIVPLKPKGVCIKNFWLWAGLMASQGVCH